MGRGVKWGKARKQVPPPLPRPLQPGLQPRKPLPKEDPSAGTLSSFGGSWAHSTDGPLARLEFEKTVSREKNASRGGL